MDSARVTLPAGWESAPLGSIADVRLGKMLSPKAHTNDLLRLPYLRNENVRWGFIDFSDLKLMGFKPSEMERYQVEAGDLLVCEGGEPGRCAIYRGGHEILMYQKALHRVRPYGGLVDNHFIQLCLAYLINSGVGVPRTSETTIRHLPLEKMQTLNVPIPPRPEQRRIVAKAEEYLTRLNAAVAALERARANLKRYRAAVLTAAVEGRLVPTSAATPSELHSQLARAELRRVAESRGVYEVGPPSDPRPIGVLRRLDGLPEGWRHVVLEDLLSEPLSNGRSVPNGPDGFPVLRLTALRGGLVDLSQRKRGAWTRRDAEPFLVRSGDFFIARGNGSLSLVGRGGLVVEPPDEVAFPDTLIRARTDPRQIEPRYLRHVWDSEVVRRQIEASARTTAGIYKVNQQDLRRITVPLPPVDEQDRIANEIERRFSIVEGLHASVDHSLVRAERLRQAILKRAFEGRLVLQHPTDEPASALLERIRAERHHAPRNVRRGRTPAATEEGRLHEKQMPLFRP